MPLKDRFLDAVNALLPEAWHVGFREAAGQLIDPDEASWRRLTGDIDRDLPGMTQTRMQKVAHWLWESNNLANRIIELPLAFLLSDGVRLAVDDEDNQALLDRFWKDPINDMDLKLEKKVRELAIFGEQCYPVFVNDMNGFARLGYLDPALIETVVMDPDNREQPIGIVTTKDKRGEARRFRVVVNGPEDVFSERTREIRQTFEHGEAFYFRVNDLSSGTRGRSDLLAQADWLDGYDQFLFGEIDRSKFLRAFIWDVTLRNANEAAVKKRASEIHAPSAASVNVHNDAETWDAVAPDLKAADTDAVARLLRNHVLGGATLPEHWFGGGGDVNRAVGAEMSDPTFKLFAMRQRKVKHMLESIGRFVLYAKARAFGKAEAIDWSAPEWTVKAEFPEFVAKDVGKFAAALAQAVVAASAAVDKGLLSMATAVRVIEVVAERLGLEIDAEGELATAQAEAKTRREQTQEADGYVAPPEDLAAQAAQDDTLREAVALIGKLGENAEARFAEIEQLAREAARERPPAGPDPIERLLEALAAASSENAKSTQALVGAIAGSVTRHELDMTLRHGKTEKIIKLPDGRSMQLTERDVE